MGLKNISKHKQESKLSSLICEKVKLVIDCNSTFSLIFFALYYRNIPSGGAGTVRNIAVILSKNYLIKGVFTNSALWAELV